MRGRSSCKPLADPFQFSCATGSQQIAVVSPFPRTDFSSLTRECLLAWPFRAVSEASPGGRKSHAASLKDLACSTTLFGQNARCKSIWGRLRGNALESRNGVPSRKTALISPFVFVHVSCIGTHIFNYFAPQPGAQNSTCSHIRCCCQYVEIWLFYQVLYYSVLSSFAGNYPTLALPHDPSLLPTHDHQYLQSPALPSAGLCLRVRSSPRTSKFVGAPLPLSLTLPNVRLAALCTA